MSAAPRTYRLLDWTLRTLCVLAWMLVITDGVTPTLRDQYDAINLARCDALCWNLDKPARRNCTRECLTNGIKSGSCPPLSEMSAWDAACLPACSADGNCPGIEKCCRHHCGATCQIPTGLQQFPGLPMIPRNLTVAEKKRGKVVHIRWDFSNSSVPAGSRVYFVVEERHHVGRQFVEVRMGEWVQIMRSQRSSVRLKRSPRAGRWYQFRVTAVGARGSRGPSEACAPYAPARGPHAPHPPAALTVVPLSRSNGTLRALLRWRAPLSDLPIARYKVFWSRRLRGIDGDLDSVVMFTRTVRKDQTQYVIKDLEMGSLYFLQVQAVSQFGSTKLRSEKASLVLNTTFTDNADDNSRPISRKIREAVYDFHLEDLVPGDDGAIAKVAWTPSTKHSKAGHRYILKWKTIYCQDPDDELHTERALFSTATKDDLYGLSYGCEYRVSLMTVPIKTGSIPDAVMSLNVPSKEELISNKD